jgi:hypothetical protein
VLTGCCEGIDSAVLQAHWEVRSDVDVQVHHVGPNAGTTGLAWVLLTLSDMYHKYEQVSWQKISEVSTI